MKIEFYVGKSDKHIAVLDDSSPPRAGEFISIRGEEWRVVEVTWAVDNADKIPGASLRACVILHHFYAKKETG